MNRKELHLRISRLFHTTWGKTQSFICQNSRTFKRLFFCLFVLFLFFIFDKPLLNWLFGKVKLLEAFINYDYSGKGWLIGVTYVLYFFYIALNHMITGWARNRIFTDVVIILAGVYYLIVRYKTISIGDYDFYFRSFSWSSQVKYMDIVILPFLYSICNFVSSLIKKELLRSDSYWRNDKPLDKNESDKYFRSKLVSEVAKQINTFSDETNSFTIGIVGPWGSGKTTFLNHLEKDVENAQNLILHFNPWQYPTEINLSLIRMIYN